ncbi:ThiF family adenylyltransferase [Nocardiopsis tropica]|uniref:ThiF family adenylyltransferase n=1 Tax=Nocardiopsis tropica TaxID=109330 RepID=A0ABU7KYL0_9ACTN|nr:ThiF family adenylyltransferase [Nocardiopsis umidischolae]MEE2053757.1 ThiF family adenylyltransferase [Nocardiopsis umidischolae]
MPDDDLLVLAPYIRIGVQDRTLFLGFGSIRQAVLDRKLWHPLVRLADHFRHGRTRAEALSFLRVTCDVDESTAQASLLMLEHGHCLIPARAYDPGDRYSRHSLFYTLSGASPEHVQARLEASHVVLIGCGGIGNLVAVTLATAGVGALTLVDADRVETSNLTRQFLFTEADVGSLKCEVLAREIGRRNSECRVRSLPVLVEDRAGLRGLPESDLILLSADSSGLTRLVNSHSVAAGQPWMNACYVNDVAVWGPLVVPGLTGCWDCRTLAASAPEEDPELAALIADVNARYQAPSNGPVNMLASSLAALDALRHLGGFGVPASLNRRMGVWSHELMLDGQSAQRALSCPTCSHVTHES